MEVLCGVIDVEVVGVFGWYVGGGDIVFLLRFWIKLILKNVKKCMYLNKIIVIWNFKCLLFVIFV